MAWMMEEEEILMDFSLTDRAIGAYLRRTTTEFTNLEWQGEKWPSGWTRGGQRLAIPARYADAKRMGGNCTPFHC
jgi:hypothetical protein